MEKKQVVCLFVHLLVQKILYQVGRSFFLIPSSIRVPSSEANDEQLREGVLLGRGCVDNRKRDRFWQRKGHPKEPH